MNLVAHGKGELAVERKELTAVLGEKIVAHVISLPSDDPGYDFYILT